MSYSKNVRSYVLSIRQLTHVQNLAILQLMVLVFVANFYMKFRVLSFLSYYGVNIQSGVYRLAVFTFVWLTIVVFTIFFNVGVHNMIF